MKTRTARELSFRGKVGYGIGEIGINFLVAGVSNYLLFFYTDVFMIGAAAAGFMMLITRIWDGINDPIMGALADRARSRWGKFRPFILFAALPTVILTVLVFTTPNLGTAGKLAWAYVTFILWEMSFTVLTVPYNALLPNLVTDSRERSVMGAIKTIFAVIGSLIIVVLAKPLTESLGGSLRAGYPITFGIFGAAALVLLVVTFLSVKEKPGTAPGEKVRLLDPKMLRTVGANRPLIIVLVFFLFFQVAFSLFRTIELYYFRYVLERDKLYSMAMLGAHVFAIGGMAVMPVLVKRFDKKLTALVAGGIGCLFFLLMYLVPGNFIVALVGICLSYFFLSVPYALFFGLVPDTVEYGEWKTGLRAAGLIISIFTFTQKMGMAIAAALAGKLLDVFGYVADKPQTARVVNGIRATRTLIPMAFVVVGMLVFLAYDLNRERHGRIVEELAKKAR